MWTTTPAPREHGRVALDELSPKVAFTADSLAFSVCHILAAKPNQTCKLADAPGVQ